MPITMGRGIIYVPTQETSNVNKVIIDVMTVLYLQRFEHIMTIHVFYWVIIKKE